MVFYHNKEGQGTAITPHRNNATCLGLSIMHLPCRPSFVFFEASVKGCLLEYVTDNDICSDIR